MVRFNELHAKNHLDPETMGIYARTWMDRYTMSNDLNDLKQSRDIYAEAFEKAPDDYYTGINAASKSVFIGTEKDLALAMEYARRVQQVTGTEPVQNDYWKTATIAELFLIQKEYTKAGVMYEKAIAMARSEKGSHESTYTQAKRLMEKLKPSDNDKDIIVGAFRHWVLRIWAAQFPVCLAIRSKVQAVSCGAPRRDRRHSSEYQYR